MILELKFASRIKITLIDHEIVRLLNRKEKKIQRSSKNSQQRSSN